MIKINADFNITDIIGDTNGRCIHIEWRLKETCISLANVYGT